LLPLSASELARAISALIRRTAGKPACKKRQQAAALQSACGARIFMAARNLALRGKYSDRDSSLRSE
jgi:hypothetical protein